MARVSQKTIADHLGVSTAAVAYALNDKPGVSDELRQRIKAVAAELGYTGNPHARALRTGKSGLVALMVRDLANPYFLDVIAGAQERADALEHTVVVVDAGHSVEREREHIEFLAGRGVDALAISPLGGAASVDLWERLSPDAPVVLLNTAHQGRTHVSVDRVGAAHLVLTHLRSLGVTRIAALVHPASLLSDQERVSTYSALAPTYGIEVRFVQVGLGLESVRAGITEVLADPDGPRAVVADCDHHAYEVYRVAAATGLRVGKDLLLVGQDDLPTSPLLDPPLTTIAFDRRNIGRALVDRLLDPALGDHHEPVELVVRASSGR